jgi:hypothetical protein
MISDEEIQFYKNLRKDIAQNPEWLASALQAVHQGVEDRLKQEVHMRVEWETVALNAMETRLFNTNKGWLSSKIEALKDKASFRWDHIIERLRK